MKSFKIVFISLTSILMASLSVGAVTFESNWYNEASPLKTGFIFNIKLLKADSESVYFYYNWNLNDYYNSDNVISNVPLFILQKYNTNTGKDSIISLGELGTKGQEKKLIEVVELDGRYHIISFSKNEKLMEYYLFDQTIDMDHFTLNDDARMISTISYKRDKIKSADYFNLTTKKENGRMLFLYSYRANIGKRNGVEIYDKNLNKEWAKTAYTPVASGSNEESDYVTDKEGNLYAIQRNYEINKDDIKYFHTSKVYLIFYPKDGSTPKGRLLDLGDGKFITGQALSINSNNELVCAGLYAEANTQSAVGAFSLIFSNQLDSIVHKQTIAFERPFFLKGEDDQAVINRINKKLDEKKDFEDEFLYHFDDIHFRKDGGFDLTGEKYNLWTIRERNSISYSNYCAYGDLIILNCNADGSFRWTQKIPKYQYLVNYYELLGKYSLNYGEDGTMNYIFNIPDTKEKRLLTKPGAASHTYMISLNPEGKESFQELFNNSEISNSFCPQLSLKCDNGRMLVVRCNQSLSTIVTGKKATITFGEIKIK